MGMANGTLDRTQCSRSIYPFGATDMGALWLQQAIGQPALLHIILSTSAIHRAGRGSLAQTSPTAQKAQRDSLKFRAITLKQLQNMVQSPTEALLESTLLIVTHLLCVEVGTATARRLSLETLAGPSTEPDSPRAM